jgi:hypothetical protein
MCPRERIAKIVGKPFIENVLNVEFRANHNRRLPMKTGSCREIEHTPGLDSPPVEVNQIRVRRGHQLGQRVGIEIDRDAAVVLARKRTPQSAPMPV